MIDITNLTDNLDVIEEDDILHAIYIQINVEEVEHLTEQAALIIYDVDAEHIWIPFSVMRCDQDSNIYVRNWFHNKNF